MNPTIQTGPGNWPVPVLLDRVALTKTDPNENDVDHELTDDYEVQQPASPIDRADQHDQGHGKGHAPKDQGHEREWSNDESRLHGLFRFFW